MNIPFDPADWEVSWGYTHSGIDEYEERSRTFPIEDQAKAFFNELREKDSTEWISLSRQLVYWQREATEPA